MLTWAYIAGFFDGDGCLSSNGNRQGVRQFNRAQFTQAGEDGTAHLIAIQEFLAAQGIRARLITKQRLRRHTKISNDLAIGSREDVTGLLRGMMPWLTIKKVLAQDYLRYFAFYPKRKHAGAVRQFKPDPVTYSIRFTPGLGEGENFWAYLAGFFDAEGCVTRKALKHGSYQLGKIDVAQVGEAGRLLFESLKAKLAVRGIQSTVVFCRRVKENEQDIYRLRTSSYADSEKFMRGMMPYLHMKKVIVQDHVRYFTLFPKMPSCENHVPNWDLLADRRSGMSLKEISAKRGIAFENVSKRLRKIEIRTGVKIQLAA